MKKLIIVCEEKLRAYGDFLAQLISRKDDSADSIMGIKDGSAAAQVWSDKEYASNAAQISSEQYILFIGNTKMMKEKRIHMQRKFSEYGMNYGWLGKQGTLFVDRVVSLGEYEDFDSLAKAEFSKGSQPELVKLLESKEKDVSEPKTAESGIEIIESEEPVETVVEPEKGLKKFFSPIGHALKKTTERGLEAASKTADSISGNINRAAKNRSIEEQEYSCLILLFYMNGLAEFLELSEAK